MRPTCCHACIVPSWEQKLVYELYVGNRVKVCTEFQTVTEATVHHLALSILAATSACGYLQCCIRLRSYSSPPIANGQTWSAKTKSGYTVTKPQNTRLKHPSRAGGTIATENPCNSSFQVVCAIEQQAPSPHRAELGTKAGVRALRGEQLNRPLGTREPRD